MHPKFGTGLARNPGNTYSSKVRILQVITDTDRRGAQVFAVDLEAALLRLGHQVTTVALAVGAQSNGLPLEVLGPARRSPRALSSLRKRMRGADITIAHGSSTLMACALTGRPFVYRQISDTRFWAAGWPRRLRVAGFLRRAGHVVALSEGAASALNDHVWLPKSHITVVPNAVPRAGFAPITESEREQAREGLGIPRDAFVALYIGALVAEKGADLAVRAAAALPGAHLLVAGGGPQAAELQALADQLSCRAHFVGVVQDTRPVYAAADVNVLPSRGGDSMPATLIESGMCGLPSVSTPVGSIEDVVVHDRTGFIVPIGDEAATTAALGMLHADEGLRRRMGAAATAYCTERFDIDVVGAQWAAVLEQCVGRRVGRVRALRRSRR